MESVNLNRLLMGEELHRVQSSLTTMGNSPLDSATLQTEVESLLASRYSAIMISNKGLNNPVTEGTYMFELSLKGLQLLEKKTTQRLQYRFSFSDQTFVLNDQKVDRSFMQSFVLKINQISSQLSQGKAKAYIKEAA